MPFEAAIEADQEFRLAMVERNVFRQESHPASGRGVAKGRSQHATAPPGGTHKAHRQVNRRALPGSIRSQKAEDFPCLHLQGEVF